MGTKDGYELVIESFTNLSAELQAEAIKSTDHGGKADAPSRYALIAASTHFVTGKLLDIFARLEMVDWMNRELSVLPYGENDQYRIYMGLAVKDFHVDVFSLLDSLASAVALASRGLYSENNQRLPGWSTIQLRKSDTQGIQRQNLAEDLCKLMDSTNSWLPAVTQIRDVLKHRDRLSLIAGDPSDGILFQLPGWTRPTPVLESVLLDSKLTDVVDFELYSAFVSAEILALLNELGLRMAAHLGVKLRTEPLSM